MTAEQQGGPRRETRIMKGVRDGHPAGDPFVSLFEPEAEPHPRFLARTKIWRDFQSGLISLDEATKRSAAVDAPEAAPRPRGPAPARHRRPAPHASRQYAQASATTAARDDRLTPNAKALLQVITARCGKGRETATTKTTLASIMRRAGRTIARYLRDLECFGYIKTKIRAGIGGLHTGLVIEITDRVRPFYAETKGLAAWLAETPSALERTFSGVFSGKPGVTLLTSKNQARKNSLFPSLREASRKKGGAPDRPLLTPGGG